MMSCVNFVLTNELCEFYFEQMKCSHYCTAKLVLNTCFEQIRCVKLGDRMANSIDPA